MCAEGDELERVKVRQRSLYERLCLLIMRNQLIQVMKKNKCPHYKKSRNNKLECEKVKSIVGKKDVAEETTTKPNPKIDGGKAEIMRVSEQKIGTLIKPHMEEINWDYTRGIKLIAQKIIWKLT